MKTQPFVGWLLTQHRHQTPVGDLARDVRQDGTIPPAWSAYQLFDYLEARGACDGAMQPLEQAWRTFSRTPDAKLDQPLVLAPSKRFRVLQRDNFRCQLCGAAAEDGDEVRLEVDHIIPRSQGGSDAISNLHTLCFACNRGKHARIL